MKIPSSLHTVHHRSFLPELCREEQHVLSKGRGSGTAGRLTERLFEILPVAQEWEREDKNSFLSPMTSPPTLLLILFSTLVKCCRDSPSYPLFQYTVQPHKARAHCCTTISRTFHPAEWKLHPVKQRLPIPMPWTPATSVLLCVPVDLTTPGTLREWNDTHLSSCDCIISVSRPQGSFRSERSFQRLSSAVRAAAPCLSSDLSVTRVCARLLRVVSDTAVNMGGQSSLRPCFQSFWAQTLKWGCWDI